MIAKVKELNLFQTDILYKIYICEIVYSMTRKIRSEIKNKLTSRPLFPKRGFHEVKIGVLQKKSPLQYQKL
jgi:hypothetical protein